MWNRLQGRRPPWLDTVKQVLDRRRADGIRPENRYGSMLWRKSIAEDARFGRLQISRWPHGRTLTADEYVDMISSWSMVAGLRPADRARTLAELRDALADDGLDELQERLQTVLYVTRLRSAPE
jgi:hypothetical protein